MDDGGWPDPELIAWIDAAPERALHELMCDCAEHALEVCRGLYLDAGYARLPDDEPLVVKRRWLAGEATRDELADAQRRGVSGCYWGNPQRLGAAILGAAWAPGAVILVAEDEAYAEGKTDYASAADAARDVLREAAQAVAELAARAAHVEAIEWGADERRWQKAQAARRLA